MSFFEGIWLKQCLLGYFYEQIGLLQAFLGSNTHFLAGYAYFFSSEYKPQLIYQNPRKNKRTFQVKKWGFDPKICFQGSYSFSDVFLGSNAHFQMRPRISLRGFVRPSDCRSVSRSVGPQRFCQIYSFHLIFACPSNVGYITLLGHHSLVLLLPTTAFAAIAPSYDHHY